MASSDQPQLELSEQTPLKSDTDAAAAPGAESTAEGGPTTTTTTTTKRWFFTKKSKGPKGEEGSAVAPSKDLEGGAAPTGNDNKKKTHWWQRKPCHELTQEQQLSYGVNLVQRDDHGLQTGIDLGYEDIYGEPDSVHSFNSIWRTNATVFQAVRSFFYKLFSFIIAIPLAIVFGVLFALVSALSVFVFVPAGVLLSIPINWVFKVWSYAVRAVFVPVFQAVGHCFGNVKVSNYGLNTDPTAVLTA